MEDLKHLFTSLSLGNVQTFIQSGNVIFEYEDEVPTALEMQMEEELEKLLGYRVDIFLRTIQEVSAIADQKFYKLKDTDTLHIVFLNEVPNKKTRQAVMGLNSEADDFKVKGREIYNLRRDRDKSVFSNSIIEKLIKAPATTRNWTTICKIAQKYSYPKV